MHWKKTSTISLNLIFYCIRCFFLFRHGTLWLANIRRNGLCMHTMSVRFHCSPCGTSIFQPKMKQRQNVVFNVMFEWQTIPILPLFLANKEKKHTTAYRRLPLFCANRTTQLTGKEHVIRIVADVFYSIHFIFESHFSASAMETKAQALYISFSPLSSLKKPSNLPSPALLHATMRER